MMSSGSLTVRRHSCHFLMTLLTFCVGVKRLSIANEKNSLGHDWTKFHCWLLPIAVIYLNIHQMNLHSPLLTLQCPHKPPLSPTRQHQRQAGKEAKNYDQCKSHSFITAYVQCHKCTWLRSSSCCLCRSLNLLSHDALSQAILVLSDRMSLSVLFNLLWSAFVRSGLPGMAAVILFSETNKEQQARLRI